MRKDAVDDMSNTAVRCPRCAAAFTCGMVAGLAACWCVQLPALASADQAATDCYCPACLRELLGVPAAAPDPD